ncbi:MAG: hypothetical protein U9P42_04930 [Candidatus Fermentibacteria bacterium]|nr:hypothetical protein [Candidatus Fermentibacteria bacterium]
MRSILKNMRDRIRDTREGKLCNCHRPHLLTFPDTEDDYEILETEVIETVNSTVQYVKTKVTAQCRICSTIWSVEVITSPDRRTRVWKRIVNPSP